MFVILGWGKGSERNLGPTYPTNCPNCHNHTYWELRNRKKWATLFFMPVVSYSGKYILQCSICSYGLVLSENQIEKAKQLNLLTKQFLADKISNEHYERQLAKVKLLP